PGDRGVTLGFPMMDEALLARRLLDPPDLRTAWAAGFLDAEGYFGVMGPSNRRRPVIEAAQVGCIAALDFLRETLGGSVRVRNSRVNHWRLEGRPSACEAIPRLLPPLSVKADEAALVL